MSNNINELSPKTLWSNFASLCNIPRPSKHEAKAVEFVIDFAKKHNLEYVTDEVGNVVIRKPATKGYESKPGIVLQGHLDMVPQKNSATIHDFEKDPILPRIDGDWVKATGTTLGADNGMGVSAALAVLESTDLHHGPVEALFTIDEETGMTGAFNLKGDMLKGRILINLDSEEEGELCIGCAGGLNTSAVFTFTPETIPAGSKAFKINLTGLKGGHSGVDIHLGRGNANKLMNRVLWKASRELGLRIASIDGGNLRNAIPRESFVTAVIPAASEKAFLNLIAEFQGFFTNELGSIEPNIHIATEPAELPEKIFDATTQTNLLNAVYVIPNGVIRMESDMPGVVETSTNLAIIKSEGNTIEIKCLLRSSIESAKTDLANAMTSVFELAGAAVTHDGGYPGWKPNVDSPILKTMKTVYKEKFGKEAIVNVIHAGLECGIIGDVYKGMDMVSFGPTIVNPHSPDEKVNIPSVEKFWTYLTETLKSV
ncbi:MAG: aminoacyl-histidine dipeptidase [Bacteroidota bacterium]|nr:aminoacyl-histidine dipeptidase [Bacteroidota bacterium]